MEPQLTDLVRRVAEGVGFAEPLLLRIAPGPGASLGRVRVEGSRVFVLVLGLPLLRALSSAEVAAVIAHELAHREQLWTTSRRALTWTRDGLVGALSDRVRVPGALAAWLLRMTQPVVWAGELAADAAGAAAVGADPTRRALEHTGLLETVFDRYATGWLEASIAAGRIPLDFYEALDLALADPLLQRRARVFAGADDLLDPYCAADHPPREQRLAALAALPPTAGGGFGSEPVRLHEAAAIAQWCVRELVEEAGEEPGQLEPENLLDMPSGRLPQPARAVSRQLQEATSAPSAPAAVAATLVAVADGSWPKLARAIEPEVRRLPPRLRRPAERDVMEFTLGLTGSALLRDAGWEQRNRWTSSVLRSPAGRTVDLHELVVGALGAGDVTALRALLFPPERS